MNTQIPTLGYLEDEAVALDPIERSRRLAAMAVAVDGLRKCRIRKLTRDAHARQYRANPEHFKNKAKTFRESERGRKFYREYERFRRKHIHYYHFLNWLRGDINRSIRRQHAAKYGRTEQLVGCPFEELKAHLESQFINGMSWDNRASFDVDHIIPVSAFLLTELDEQLWAFNWRNLRPLDPLANKRKSDTLPSPLPSWLPAHIAARILERYK